MKHAVCFAFSLGFVAFCHGQQGWWMREPIRWVQTNLRETDASLDPRGFIGQVAQFDANVLLMAMGGISAFYPSQVPYHHVSPFIPKGRDTFGEVLRQAHARGIRVVARFDLSKAHKDAFDAHPEWFFKKPGGEPAPYNGLYQACINGGWYREKAVEILTEALERYDVDGLFFNMFSNPSSDYSGNSLGICQCDNCRRLFHARFGRELPARPDADYQAFLGDSTRTMSETIRKLIKSRRPNAMLVGTSAEITDGVFSESNTAVRRPLPLWPYASSYNVNRARNSYPEKMAINQCMSFIDFPWRFATVPQNEIRIRLWQNVAHGGAAAFNVHGTLEQQDRTAVEAARPIYSWLKEHQEYFVAQRSAARVVLLGRVRGTRGSDSALRGVFRLLSEEHIPFGMTDNLEWLGKREVDLVVAAGEVPQALEPWVRQGGRLLVASPAAVPFEMARPVKMWKDIQAYFRIRDHARFPSLKSTDVTFMYGDYLEVEGTSPVTFIPPSMFGPPELVHVDWRDTAAPGLIWRDFGKGRIAWLPWDLGALYYQHSSEAHARLFRDLVDDMLPRGRQLKTNAHPLVEFALMRQQNRRLLHVINLSGHSQTGYFDPVPMRDIRIQLSEPIRTARSVATGNALPVSPSGEIVVPELKQYELIELK